MAKEKEQPKVDPAVEKFNKAYLELKEAGYDISVKQVPYLIKVNNEQPKGE